MITWNLLAHLVWTTPEPRQASASPSAKGLYIITQIYTKLSPGTTSNADSKVTCQGTSDK